MMLVEERGSVRAVLLGVALITGSVGCGAEADLTSSEPSSATLRRGARGPEVRAAYEYLRKYGYFPNTELERASPDFRPMVPAPADPELFDEHVAAALQKFQKNAGIEVTGELDVETQSLIGRPRCATPDEDPDAERDSKWAFLSRDHRWNSTQPEITYRINTGGCGADCLPNSSLTTVQARSAINSAIASWQPWTYANFTEVTVGGDVVISFVTGLPADSLGRSAPPGPEWYGLQGPVIQIHKTYPFTASQFKQLITHEFGHVMGLRHTPEKVTSAGGAATIYARMYAYSMSTHNHLLGDRMGASVALGVFNEYMGLTGAIDADANNAGSSYRIWALSSTGQPMQYSGGTWTARGGITGKAIAVCPDNTAWVVRTSGGISSWSASSSSWVTQPMPAGLTARAVGCSEGDASKPYQVYAAMSDGNVYGKMLLVNEWGSLGGPGGTINEVDVGADFAIYALKSSGELWRKKAGVWALHSAGPLKDIGVGGDATLTNIWAIDANDLGVAWAEHGAVGQEFAVKRWEPINEPGPTKRIFASRDRAFTLWSNDKIYMRTPN